MEISLNIYEMESYVGKIKKLMEISFYISEMQSSIGKIKDGRVLESTKAFYYIEGAKESEPSFYLWRLSKCWTNLDIT